MLSPKAIGYSAGVIDYFVREFDKINKEKIQEEKLSFLEKLKNNYSSLLSSLKYNWGDTLIASRSFVGGIFSFTKKETEGSLENLNYFVEANKEVLQEVEKKLETAAKEGGQVLSAKITAEDLFEPKKTEASDNNSIPVSLPSIEQKITPLPLKKDEIVFNKKEEEKTESEILETKTVSGSAFIIPGGDGAPPETAIISSPEKISSSSMASFVFSSSESGSGFAYNLNNNGWQSCGDRLDLTGLADGEHIIEIRASDRSGNIDPSPAVFRWLIDTRAPISVIIDKPTNPTNLTTAEFKLTVSEEAIFNCWLDRDWQDCTSPINYTNLDSGQHIFKVRAIDLAGNVEVNPVEYEW